jgi:hypothetical protein
LPIIEPPANGHSSETSQNGKPTNGKPTNGKPANGKASGGKTLSGKVNGTIKGAAARIVALKIVDGVPISSDHDLTVHSAEGIGPPAMKRRNGHATGKNGSNGNGNGNGNGKTVPRPKAVARAEDPALKHELLRRPARPPNGVAERKANGKSTE